MEGRISPAGSTASRALRTIIVDDEKLARDCVRLVLEQDRGIEVVAECEDGPEAVEAIERLNPDLVFLDIQMPSMSGFDVLERLPTDALPHVVFVTAFDAHAIRAFEVHALDYVLKPFDDERLRRAVERARDEADLRRSGEISRRLSALLGQEEGILERLSGERDRTAGPITRIAIREEGRVHFVSVVDVDWFEGAGNYVHVHAGDNVYRIRSTLTALLSQLDPVRFIRVHRSTVINVERVREVQPWFGGDHIAVLRSGEKLRVSRTYAQDLLRPWR